MRRWADLHLAESERRQCANMRHSRLAVIGRGACNRPTFDFRVKRDVQNVKVCDRDRRSSPSSDDAANTRFSPNRDVREVSQTVQFLPKGRRSFGLRFVTKRRYPISPGGVSELQLLAHSRYGDFRLQLHIHLQHARAKVTPG
jgi:hypothetical protein